MTQSMLQASAGGEGGDEVGEESDEEDDHAGEDEEDREFLDAAPGDDLKSQEAGARDQKKRARRDEDADRLEENGEADHDGEEFQAVPERADLAYALRAALHALHRQKLDAETAFEKCDGRGGGVRKTVWKKMNILEKRVPPGGAEARSQVGNAAARKKAREAAQDGVAEAPEGRLGGGGPGGDDHVGVLERVEEFRDGIGRMLAVGVHEDKDGRRGGADAGLDGGAVAEIFLVNDDFRARLPGKVRGRVPGTIVDDEKFRAGEDAV